MEIDLDSLVIRECMHFFTLPQDPVMVMNRQGRFIDATACRAGH